MAKYDLERAIVHALNENIKDYGGNIKFDFTSRRASASELKSCSGIDKIKVTMKNKKPFLNVMLYKNFTDMMGGWRSGIDGLQSKVKKAVLEAGLGNTFDVASGTVIKPASKNTSHSTAEVSKESQMSMQLAEIASQLMLGDFDELDQSEVLRKFMLVMRSGDAVLIPEKTWRSTGLNRHAAKLRVQVYRQDLSSKILAVARADLDKVCQAANVLMTEDLTISTGGSVQVLSNKKLNPVTPEMTQKIMEATKVENSSIADAKKQLEFLENPDAGYKKLLDIQNGSNYEGKALEGRPLTDVERRTLNILTAVVEKGMVSVLNKKRQDLRNQIASLTASRNAKEAEIRGTQKAPTSEKGSGQDILQIVKQKAGNYKYFLALYFNGQQIKF